MSVRGDATEHESTSSQALRAPLKGPAKRKMEFSVLSHDSRPGGLTVVLGSQCALSRNSLLIEGRASLLIREATRTPLREKNKTNGQKLGLGPRRLSYSENLVPKVTFLRDEDVWL